MQIFFIFFIIFSTIFSCSNASPRSPKSNLIKDFPGFGEGFFIFSSLERPVIYYKSFAFFSSSSNVAHQINSLSLFPSISVLKIYLIFNNGIDSNGFITCYERKDINSPFLKYSDIEMVYSEFLDRIPYFSYAIESKHEKFERIIPNACSNDSSPTSIVENY